MHDDLPGQASARSSPDGSPLVNEVAEWLADQALGDTSVGDLMQGCSERLLAAGLPLWRSYLGYRTLHPLFASISLIWKRGEDFDTVEHSHENVFQSEAWVHSPLNYVIQRGLPFLRRRLRGDEALLDFEILRDLRDQGGSDYLLFRIPFLSSTGDRPDGPAIQGVLGSWTTDRAGGFTDQDIRDLTRIQRRLAVACKVQIKSQVAKNVLDTYLGMDAGRKVLDGQIRRGDGEQVHAVLWYSDMRDSTPLADALPREEFLALLNTYFECTAGAVLAHQGEVLRFIGDAVLAIFPIRGDEHTASEACAHALAAMGTAGDNLKEVNQGREALGLSPIRYGLALHLGDVVYGNIGVPERLEFSVVGPAANEAARLESLTKELREQVLISEDFVASYPGAYRSLGRHNLRGVGEEMEVFAPGTGTL